MKKTWKESLRHAFALTERVAAPLASNDSDSLALIDRIADAIASRRLAAPALLFIESAKPLSFLGNQMLLFLEPLVKSFVKGKTYDRFAKLLERRENVDLLLERIEYFETHYAERLRKGASTPTTTTVEKP